MTTSTTGGTDYTVATKPKVVAAPTKLRRVGFVPALDGFRGVAICLVLLVHLQLLVPFKQTGIALIDNFIKGGFFGVDLFFVLSGFLITGLLLGELGRTRKVKFGSFYARRALRLLPALYVFLLFQLAYGLGSGLDIGPQLVPSAISAFFYVTNWQIFVARNTIIPIFTHLWSLSIEEQFYLLWPATLVGYLGVRRKAKWVVATLCVAIVGVFCWRMIQLHQGQVWQQLIIRTDTRVDQLLIGSLLAVLWVRGLTPVRHIRGAAWIASATLVVCISTFVGTEDSVYQWGIPIFGISAAVVLLALLDGRWIGRRFFELRPLRAMGRVSYGVYIWHYPIFFIVGANGGSLGNAGRTLLALGLTAVVVAVSWYFVEKPALAFKARFSQKSRPVVGHSRISAGPRHWILIALAAVALGCTVGVIVGPTVKAKAVGVFLPGNEDRRFYWGLAGLDTVARDNFNENRDQLGGADEGGMWAESGGAWRVEDKSAMVDSSADRIGLALLPEVAGDNGLSEVTLTVSRPGAGLVFNYRDSDNFWSVTVSSDGERWIVERFAAGERETVGLIEVTPKDNATVTAIQSLYSFRVLIDGVDGLTTASLGDEVVMRAGLIDYGTSDGARWNRFLQMSQAQP